MATALASLSFLMWKAAGSRGRCSIQRNLLPTQVKSSQAVAVSWLSGTGWSEEAPALRSVKRRVSNCCCPRICSSEAGTGVCQSGLARFPQCCLRYTVEAWKVSSVAVHRAESMPQMWSQPGAGSLNFPSTVDVVLH